MKVWPHVSPHRKHTLLEDLEDLAEAETLTSFDDVARSLLDDTDPQVRARAIRLLWECEDAKLVPVYLDMLNNDEAVEVRAAAANALGQFVYLGELEKIPKELHQKIEDELLGAATSAKEVLVRRRALESLGYTGRAEVVPLIEAASREKDPDWKVSALFAMGRSCDDRWKKQVLSQLRSPNEDIRSEAIHAAGELELESARPVLLDLLEDEEDLEEALDTLSFTEDMGGFSLLDVDPEVDFIEEEPDEKE
jgi:HEAT repeat protein